MNVRTFRIKTRAKPSPTRQREMSMGNDPGETLTAIGSAGVVYNRKDEMT